MKQRLHRPHRPVDPDDESRQHLEGPDTYYKVPTTQTVMHRIVQGPDGNIWFTELGSTPDGRLAAPAADVPD